MKTLVYYVAVILLIFTFTQCEEDFLEKPPLGELNTGTFPESPSDAKLAVNGVYNTLRVWNYHAGGFPILDIISDEAVKGSNPGDGAQILPYDDFTFDANASSFDRWWATLYQGIRRAHLVMEGVPEVKGLSITLKNRYVAEARFLRANFYFNLVRSFGAVPMVTTSNPPTKLPRTPAEDIYNEIIIPDLEYAISHLPEKSAYPDSELGRATKGAARGMLAKVYLFMNDFTNAEKYALEVINSGEYDLDPDFAHVFSVEGEHGPGSLFEIGALSTNFSNGGNQYANTFGVRGTPNLGWGFGRPSWELIQFFGDDPRKDATVLFLGETIGDGILVEGDNATPDTTYADENQTIIEQVECYNQKTLVPGTKPTASYGHNRRILRYADVLLIAAEALNENDTPSEALVYLNRVRERARGGNTNVLPDITTTEKGQLRQAIWEERHRELAMEGHRYWDLVRTGQAASVLGPLGFETNKHELLPVPQAELDMSEGAWTQNLGYN